LTGSTAPWGQGAFGEDPFGNLIDCEKKLTVLLFERRVQREEGWAPHIPMADMRLANQCVRVGHELS
jgi:hypothetical protein